MRARRSDGATHQYQVGARRASRLADDDDVGRRRRRRRRRRQGFTQDETPSETFSTMSQSVTKGYDLVSEAARRHVAADRRRAQMPNTTFVRRRARAGRP